MIAITGAILLSSAMTAPPACCWPALAAALIDDAAQVERSATEAALKDWRYPGSQFTLGGKSVSIYGLIKSETSHGEYTTADPFEKVIGHYEQRANAMPDPPAGPIRDIQRFSGSRPVKIWSLAVSREEGIESNTICVIVSRADGEEKTYVAIKRLRLVSPPPQ